MTAFEGLESQFGLAIIAFGAFESIVPKYCFRLGEMDKRSLDSLIQGGCGLLWECDKDGPQASVSGGEQVPGRASFTLCGGGCEALTQPCRPQPP